MKKMIISVIIMVMMSAATVKSQVANPISITSGCKINYELSLGYDFEVSVLELSPDFIFNWTMGGTYSGKEIVRQSALKSAKKLVNDFTPGDTAILQDATTVMLSSAIYKKLKSGKPATIVSNDSVQKLSFIRNEKMNIKVDNVDVALDVLYAETELNHKYWIWDNANTPFIFKMELGWTLMAKSISLKK